MSNRRPALMISVHRKVRYTGDCDVEKIQVLTRRKMAVRGKCTGFD
jgi:hypothetical protein